MKKTITAIPPDAVTPANFKEADLWAAVLNQDRDESAEATWSFDVGMKLDFDGPLISVISRFYPPGRHSSEGWSGEVTINLGALEIETREIKSDTIVALSEAAHAYVEEVRKSLHEAIQTAAYDLIRNSNKSK